MAAFDAAGVPAGPVLSLAEVSVGRVRLLVDGADGAIDGGPGSLGVG